MELGPSEPTADVPRRRRLLMAVVRIFVFAVVVGGVGRRIWLEREKLASYEHTVDLGWLSLSGVLYILGLVPCAVFWRMAVRDRGPAAGWLRTLAAYFAGHLAKYVPGKGLVVVVRAGLLRDAGVSLATGGVTCAHETLLMMATGAAVACLALTLVDLPHWWLLWLSAAGSAGILTVVSAPPTVDRWSALVTRPFRTSTDADHRGARWRTVWFGAATIGLGWLLMGLSFGAVFVAMDEWPGVLDQFGPIPALAMLVATVALATVGGFITLLPGGLVSREWIVVEVLGPAIGVDQALVAAVYLRITWIAAEVVATGLFWILDWRWRIRTNQAR